ncbi:hypothetical protein [Clostridium estertheticum]|uniref:hypothetical protein n=1 Tax=Clostridium estertheticum TaxID=238834 RepID=UPI001CF16504|nr:hypothetical protein [Clostridium estertheticum]MCB2355292.1 hypothetical protein [Clostridium estertheticum]WAG39574.1 hypothetical protein LL065_14875 [Clostridium estertheticum]
MFIETNPKEKIYRDLIDLAFEVCNEFVLRSDMDINTNINHVLEKLQLSLKEVKEQFEWPGTIYHGDKPALVYYYSTDNYAKEILKQVLHKYTLRKAYATYYAGLTAPMLLNFSFMKTKGMLALLMVLRNLGAERKTCEKLASIFL